MMPSENATRVATRRAAARCVLREVRRDVVVSATSIPLSKNGDTDVHLSTHPEARHEAAKINDELRYSIIDAVYLRPAIWDHGREPKSLGQRKDYFIEIAALLSTEDNILSCYDIEKQWKNLKDTYFKTRKKVVTDESGCIVPPRWKFFSAMTFLDQLSAPQTSSAASPSQHTHSVLGKRTSDRKPLERRFAETRAVSCGAEPQRTPSASRHSGVSLTSLSDDEYVVFCNSLIYPLREIGSISRVELLKLQKEIRDAIHEKQMALLQGQS
ncbi:hypothetical protein Tcan_05799 [Toxocara canis]|uniref:MADF domain-containing protein n=1 Tax=Toxocara canis TaxID=6265 RepID=A0A0B2VZM9_TOXCA|nr:hypothetical protein Tcan_05799 [Toxocara canis]